MRLSEPQLLQALSSTQLDQLWRGSVTPRRIGPRGDLVTDCQFVLNEPVGADATTQPAHVDNPKEIYAGLLYLRKPEDRATGGDFSASTQHLLFIPQCFGSGPQRDASTAADRTAPQHQHHWRICGAPTDAEASGI